MKCSEPARAEPRLAFLIADVGEPERHSRVREPRALSVLLFGARHEITVALSVGVADPDATDRALQLLNVRQHCPSGGCSRRSGA